MGQGGRRVLLVGEDTALREILALILREAGYGVEAASGDNAAEVVAQTAPDAIVLEIRPTVPGDWAVLDALQADPTTREIPVVAFSTADRATAEARASPNTRQALVGAFSLDELLGALVRALGDPPPAAVLPGGLAASPAAAAAGRALGADARNIVLAAVRRLLREEPFRTRFGEVALGLVDNLGTLLGAIVAGLHHGLEPDRVFATPAIHSAVGAHARLRREQGIDLAATLREYRALRVEIDRAVAGLVGHGGVTADGALEVSRRVADYIDALVGLVVAAYQLGPEPGG
jgi:CheY-like chemotaxis protein